MSRGAALTGLCILSICLAAGARAQEGSGQAEDGASPGLQTLEPAQDLRPLSQEPQPVGAADPEPARDGPSASDPGFDSLSAGRKAREAGDLEQASTHFQDALIRAVPGGPVQRAAQEELSYRLPLARVEALIADEQWRAVDESLGRLLERHESDDAKSVYLLRLIGQLQERAPDDAGDRERRSGNGREVMQNVEAHLERFLAKNGRYPSGYDELNKVLPPDQAPLSEYDIVDYVTRGRAYGLTLRSKEDPDNVIQVQKTGLMQ